MPHPVWIRVKAPHGEEYTHTLETLAELGLHTVCREALCPNQRECFEARTATFLIGGRFCTRGCRFCGVARNRTPPPPDPGEPERVAEAVRRLGSRFVVITSVNRDDLPDQGVSHWIATIRAVRERNPGVFIEALIPDFQGELSLLHRLIEERPEILSHNLETVPRLYSRVRGGAEYSRSLAVLKEIAASGIPAKTGIMLGLGEREEELWELLKQVADTGVKILTLGQYLRPSPWHLPVLRYYHPEEFEAIRERALSLGFLIVESGPFVRSSYHVHKQAEFLRRTFLAGEAVAPDPCS